jgi:hypothetical protein
MVNRGTSIADSRLMADQRTLPISELGPDEPRGEARTGGISPQDPGSMPRAEDDDETFERSPEFHDTPAPRPDER